jgi:hypothetical protein
MVVLALAALAVVAAPGGAVAGTTAACPVAQVVQAATTCAAPGGGQVADDAAAPHPDPAYRGSATIAAGVTGWRWSGRAWVATTTGAGGAGWSTSYTGAWAWAWTAATGWLAVPRTAITATDLRQPPLLRARGRFLYDRDGRVVFLHGVNAVWKQAPYSPPSTLFGDPLTASAFDERDGAWLAANGFNSVRLGVMWAAVEPTRGTYDDAYLARMRTIA